METSNTPNFRVQDMVLETRHGKLKYAFSLNMQAHQLLLVQEFASIYSLMVSP